MAKYFGKGIPVASGFDLNAKAPLDARTVASNLEELNAMPDIQRYDGLMVYVESEERNYQLINGEWQQLATSGDVDNAIKGQIIDGLTSDSAEAALSARQGKILKGQIDAHKTNEIDGQKHVPATGTGNGGKVLKAGSTAGALEWANISFNELTGKPTTLAGYGITDAAPKVQTNDRLSAIESAMNVEISDQDVTDIIDFIKQPQA